MSDHVVKLDPTATIRADVTPERAGWRHLGFQLRALRAGEGFVAESDGHEVCLVLLAGDADLGVAGEHWSIAGRRGVFEGLPYALYVPRASATACAPPPTSSWPWAWPRPRVSCRRA